MILSAQDFDSLYHLGSVPVSYPPKDIRTEALQVTPGNIGALSLELHTSLRYTTDGGLPYLVVKLERGTDDDPQEPAKVHIRVDEWIIVLWDQLHIFRDAEFRNTFQFENIRPQHELKEIEQLEARADDVLRHYEPTITGNLGGIEK